LVLGSVSTSVWFLSEKSLNTEVDEQKSLKCFGLTRKVDFEVVVWLSLDEPNFLFELHVN
jgi:hypothetical protein